MATGLVWHEQYMWHDTGHWAGFVPPGGLVQPGESFESPEPKRRLYNLLDASGLLGSLTRIEPRPASQEQLLRFHTPGYLARLAELSRAGGGDAGEFTPFGAGSYEIACLAAGGAIAAVDAVLDGRVENAYALVRPPGHHAEPDRGRGFCLLGNVALAVMHARAVRGVERVAVVDWDVHHGNGTQLAFYSDPSVLTISLHQDRAYPFDSGLLAENGEGRGRGYNINVPLPAGSGDGAYRSAMERIVVPALQRMKPDLIVVACGFDASFLDPLGRMLCHSDTYREMTRVVTALARELCGGRLVLCHEGGYSAAYVPACGLAVVEQLAGVRTAFVDAAGAAAAATGGQDLLPHQEAVIAAAMPLVAAVGGAR
jgi:acetoin utilization deacetylase AcuC-like enzyme